MIVTLLLTGRATPYIHNGVINVGDENSYVSGRFDKPDDLHCFPFLFAIRFQAVAQYGVLKRCMIGLLLWDIESTSVSGM